MSDSTENTNRERFVRLASARTQKAIQAIELLNNCVNRSQYEYTPSDWEKILNAISSEHATLAANVKASIEGKKVVLTSGFTL